MTDQNTAVEQQAEPTLTIGETTYPVSTLSDEVKEMLSLHEQAVQMATAAKRQATIHDLAVANIAAHIEKAVQETDE